MNNVLCFRSFFLAMLFIKEQLKEPAALFWIVISPVVTFYLLSYAKEPQARALDYLSSTSWFYAFVASSVALFGLAFYIVGRRESGFLRSFVYTKPAKAIFLVGQFLAYSCMAVMYCSVFYILTRSYSGVMGFSEFVVVIGRFYICFLLFSTFSLLLTLIPVGFQNSSTVFSIFSFTMLAFGIVSINSSHPAVENLRVFNPMWWANKIMLNGVWECLPIVIIVFILFVVSIFLAFRFMIINPVWSRY